ncbi:hypothetical protein [Corynebacterium rouxii]|uniref:Uncharacterized protein n=1 Tax=Corynebacterium rouxii TaxID=2719119 RepID=A0A6I8MC78_9CORY|nr:hypothetical protein [Corynebacterium rouxii]VZH85315.1 hypothetical protein FRC0190_01281 [Corynebacterium rouxii]
MQVVLKCAFDIPSMGLRLAGTVVDVAGEDLEVMRRRDVIAGESSEVEPEPVVVPEPDPVEEPVSETPVKKPLKSAGIDAWRVFATGLGIDVKGLKKPEIIAAVNAVS